MVKELLDPATFDFVARFFLAGFIAYSLRARFVLGARARAGEVVVEAIVLSLINQVIFSLLLTLLGLFGVNLSIGSAFADNLNLRFMFYLEVLALPPLMGYAIGRNLNAGWQDALLRRLSMPVTQPSQRAHDFAFGNDRKEGYVILTFENGDQILGYFGPKSMAANDTNRSDLFLESLYRQDEDENWIETSPPRSALISLNNVRFVEFLETGEEGEG